MVLNTPLQKFDGTAIPKPLRELRRWAPWAAEVGIEVYGGSSPRFLTADGREGVGFTAAIVAKGQQNNEISRYFSYLEKRES